ncbi:protein ENL-like [Paramacrobiotus metropolitanus]|uniref:protein ENL-like n=1 Tax=Paramacrobiotus metropolitanus TaxID=2943436 RepID=UPI00244575C8|nr:protein ENL-like [Paramacrobiotus metropolitanus]
MSATPRKPTARKTVVPVMRVARPSRELAGLPFGYSPESDEAQSSSRVTRARVSTRSAEQPVFSAQSPGPSGIRAAMESRNSKQRASKSKGKAILDALRRRNERAKLAALARRDAAVISRGRRRGKFPTDPDVEILQPSPPKSPQKKQSIAVRQLGTPDLTEEEPESSETPSVRAKRDEEHLQKGGILYVPYDPKAPRPVFKTKQTARKRAHSGVFPRMALADKQELAKHQKTDAEARQAIVASSSVENEAPQPSTSAAAPYYLRSRGQKRKRVEMSPSSSSESGNSSSDDDYDSTVAVSDAEIADDEAEDSQIETAGSGLEEIDVDPLPSLQPVVPIVLPVPATVHEDSPEIGEPIIYVQPHSNEL